MRAALLVPLLLAWPLLAHAQTPDLPTPPEARDPYGIAPPAVPAVPAVPGLPTLPTVPDLYADDPASVDPDILIAPDDALRFDMPNLAPPDDPIEYYLRILPRPDLSGGCFGVDPPRPAPPRFAPWWPEEAQPFEMPGK